MKRRSNKLSHFNKALAWLFLIAICNLLLFEGFHSHKAHNNSQIFAKNLSKDVVFKQPQPFCNFCDHLLHQGQSHCLAPATNDFTQPFTGSINRVEAVPLQVVFELNDLLLFSGNSPPSAC